MNNKAISTLSLVYAFMLLICWYPKLPYLYFQFIRVIGLVVFGLLAYINHERNNMPFAIIFGVSLLIIQPFIKIPLGRFNWNVLDTIWAVLIIVNSIQLFKTKN
jgi:hypothetical protein